MRYGLAAALFLILANQAAAAGEPQLYKGEKLVTLTLPADDHLVLDGWTREGRSLAYRLELPKGRKLKVSFRSSSPRFTYLVIFDLKDEDPEDSIFSSDTNRLPARIESDDHDMDLLIRPFFAKQAPRRGLGSHFVIEIQPDGNP